MTNPAITDYEAPDLEAHLTQTILHGCPVRLWVEEVEYPWPHWGIHYTVALSVTGPGKAAANQNAHDVHDKVLASRYAPWDDGHINVVDTLTAPAWMPRQNGAPAYACRYRFTVRPKGQP